MLDKELEDEEDDVDTQGQQYIKALAKTVSEIMKQARSNKQQGKAQHVYTTLLLFLLRVFSCYLTRVA